MSKHRGNLLLFFIIFPQVKESQCNINYVQFYIVYVFTLRHRPTSALSTPLQTRSHCRHAVFPSRLRWLLCCSRPRRCPEFPSKESDRAPQYRPCVRLSLCWQSAGLRRSLAWAGGRLAPRGASTLGRYQTAGRQLVPGG